MTGSHSFRGVFCAKIELGISGSSDFLKHQAAEFVSGLVLQNNEADFALFLITAPEYCAYIGEKRIGIKAKAEARYLDCNKSGEGWFTRLHKALLDSVDTI